MPKPNKVRESFISITNGSLATEAQPTLETIPCLSISGLDAVMNATTLFFLSGKG